MSRKLDRESRRHAIVPVGNIRRAEYGYRDMVDRKEYKYYFSEGFERGTATVLAATSIWL